MGKPKAVRDAEARLAGIDARADAKRAELEAIAAKLGPLTKRRNAIQHRRQKQVIVLNSAGDVALGTMAGLTIESYMRDSMLGKKPREIVEAIDTGAAKVHSSFTFGASYTAKGLVQRIRIPTPESIKAATVARRKLDRARKAHDEAKAAEKAARLAMYESGEKLTREQIVESLFAEAKASLAYTAAQKELGHPANVKHELERLMADDEWSERGQAKLHLHHAQVQAAGNEADACPCRQCQEERHEAQRQRAEDARIAELPVVTFDCPSCGRRHRGATEVQNIQDRHVNDALRKALDEKAPGWQQLSNNDRWYPAYLLDTVYCAKARHWFPWTTGIVKSIAKVEKAAQRARGTAVREWTCPNPECGEVNEVIGKPGDYVRCEACEVEFDADVVVYRRAKAA